MLPSLHLGQWDIKSANLGEKFIPRGGQEYFLAAKSVCRPLGQHFCDGGTAGGSARAVLALPETLILHLRNGFLNRRNNGCRWIRSQRLAVTWAAPLGSSWATPGPWLALAAFSRSSWKLFAKRRALLGIILRNPVDSTTDSSLTSVPVDYARRRRYRLLRGLCPHLKLRNWNRK